MLPVNVTKIEESIAGIDFLEFFINLSYLLTLVPLFYDTEYESVKIHNPSYQECHYIYIFTNEEKYFEW